MYWDLPPLERRKPQHGSTANSVGEENEKEDEHGLTEDGEEGNDEGKPLMGSQELVGSYGSVVTPNAQRRNNVSSASNATLNHISPPQSPPPSETLESSTTVKNFSKSRGRFWGILPNIFFLFKVPGCIP